MHEQTGHANKRSLTECVKSRLAAELQIEEKHIRKYKSDDRHMCNVCARAKLTRTSFNKIRTIRGAALGDYISVDIAVFVNCKSREGYKYVVYFVDQFSWVYPMKTCDKYIDKLRHLIDTELHSHGAKIKQYYADGARYTWNSADTLERNSTSERNFVLWASDT
jgi:hypothetical protein